MTSQTKEIRNQICALRKSLDSAPKSEHPNIKGQIEELEQKLTELRKSKEETVASQEEPQAGKKEFKPSKAMLKKQAQQAQMDAERVKAFEFLSTSSAKVIADGEEADLLEQFTLHNLTLVQITPDGNCLFSAIKHQLTFMQTPLVNEDLRQLAVQNIRNNRSEYEMFMVDEFLEAYCERMSRPGEWGGQLELVALSKALNLNIRVFQAHTEPLVFSAPNDQAETLNISFHRHAYALGEHYNSLIKKVH